MAFSRSFKTLTLIAAIFMLLGCAAQRAYDQGRDLIEHGEAIAGLTKVEEATRLDPSQREYQVYLARQRELAIQRWVVQAEDARAQGKLDDAEAAFQKILKVEPTNVRGLKGLELIAQGRRLQGVLTDAEALLKKGNVEGAYGKARAVLAIEPNQRAAQTLMRKIEAAGGGSKAGEPRLKDSFRKPMTMEFRDASVRQVFELISRNTGLNFIFDRDVRSDLRTTLMVQDTSVEEIVRFLLVTNQLEQKILNESTVLIYPATQAKQRDYQDLMTRSFFLGNADVKQVATLIKSVLKVKDVFADEKLSVVTLRETPAMLRAVERMLANHDLPEPEVVMEMEVLEVSSTQTSALGISYPDQISAGITGAAGTAGSLTWKEALGRPSSLLNLSISNPALAINLKDQLAKANILANPRIRVKNREKAKIHVGDKVPVISTTTTSNGVISESVSYLDTGLKLEVEPDIHLDDEVGIKINLEVSNIANEVRSSSGTLTYQLGTRNANTVLRLKDGETQVLAGLISDEDRTSANRIPGLGALPVAGRLFGSQGGTADKKEIVLLVTPHIVRNLVRPEPDAAAFMSGTEATAGAPEMTLLSRKSDAVTEAEKAGPAGASRNGGPPNAPVATSKVTLQAPPQVIAGQPFKVLIGIEAGKPTSSAVVELVFDPERFRVVSIAEGEWVKNTANHGFRSSAVEGAGRIALSVAPETPLNGEAEIAVVTLEANTIRPISTTLRVEKATLIDAKGKPLKLEPSVPFVMSLIK